MLDKKRCLLIVTDVQGKLAEMMFEREKLYKNVGIMIDSFKILGISMSRNSSYVRGILYNPLLLLIELGNRHIRLFV